MVTSMQLWRYYWVQATDRVYSRPYSLLCHAEAILGHIICVYMLLCVQLLLHCPVLSTLTLNTKKKKNSFLIMLLLLHAERS